MKPIANPFLRATMLAVSSMIIVGQIHAAPIIWGAATTISGDSNVLTTGATEYAYTFSSATQTAVNGVTFTKTASTTTIGTDVTLSTGFTNNGTTFAPNPSAGTWSGLTTAYKGMLQGGDYGGTGAQTVTLQSLTSDHVYATQIWVNDSRSYGNGRTETVTSTGGNTVTLDYNSSNANGGVGQFTIGRFAASGTTQEFTLKGNVSTQLNALQVRDVTNIGNWVGIGGATWDAATTNNFASNLYNAVLVTTNFGTAKTPMSSVTFADSYWNSGSATTVSQTTVSIASAGVSTGTVYFDNSSVNYTIGNASGATGITGSTAIVKNGSGTVTLNGANTHTGGTTITAGTLKTGVNGALSTGDYALTITGGTLDLNGIASQQVSAFNGSGGTVLNSIDDTTAKLIAGGNNLGGTYSGTITDNAGGGATGKVSLGKVGSGTQILSNANSYSGGTTITGGTVQIDHANALGTAGTIAFDGPASGTLSILKWGTGITTDLSSRITVNATKTAVLNTNGNDLNFADTLTFTSGTGNLYKEGTGKLTLNSGFTMGRLDINAGTVKVADGTFNLGGFFTVNTTGTAAAYEQTGGTVNLTSNNGAYIGNSGTPTSSFTLSGGAFNVGNDASKGSDGIWMRAGGTSTMNLIGSGTLSNSYTTNTSSGGLRFEKTANTTANFNLGGGSGTFSGGSNILDGGTSGILSVNRVLYTSGIANFNFNGGTLKATMNNTSSFFGSSNINAYVKDAGGIINNNGKAIGMSQSFQHGGDAATDGGLVFKGAGTTTLTGASSYNGQTTIDGGTVALGTGGSISNSSGVNLINAGHFNVSALTSYSVVSLTGNGTVTGDLTVTDQLAIGNSPGTVTFSDNLGLGTSATSTFEINNFTDGFYDLALGRDSSQTVTFGGTLIVNFLSGFNTNGSVKIFDFETYAGKFSSYTFNNLAIGFTASFDDATGLVTVIPEPGAAALGVLGTLVLFRRRRA